MLRLRNSQTPHPIAATAAKAATVVPIASRATQSTEYCYQNNCIAEAHRLTLIRVPLGVACLVQAVTIVSSIGPVSCIMTCS
jgi:hypothetical protein